MQIKGVVNEIIFRNAENGYTVVDIDNDGVLTTAVGIFPPISEGEQLLLDGEFKFNNRFGEQFVADKVRISPPNSEENIIRFLSSGLFRGIGKVYAEHIVERFKSDTLTIIETMPSEIASIKGIGLKKATELSETFNNNKEMQETIIYLQQYDISVNLAIKIYKKYRNTTQFVITTNPYKMIADIDGIGFLTADKIALNMGLQRDSSYRVKACIGYVLNDSALKNGNTYLTENDILKEVIKMLEFGEDRVDFVSEMINDMLIMDDIKIIRKQDYNAVMLTKYYNLERNISKKILALNDRSGIINEDIDNLISEYEFINKIKLHETQKDAVVSALNNGCLIITGGPGTGKTTIIKCIIYILKQRNIRFSLCAPTGRAAKRMSEATGEEAKTIHRLLDLNFKGEDYKAAFTYDENTRLPSEVIIIDEVSMCDEYVFSSLIKAIDESGRLIMVGDSDQLPSVGAGNVLSDIIESKIIPVVKLTQIYRQDENSLIVSNAHRINQGLMPIIDNTKKDFFFINKSDATDVLNEVTNLCLKRLPEYKNIDFSEIQVLAPMKKGISGVNNLNLELQKNLNSDNHKDEIIIGETIYRLGDKVIHLMNNYNLEWTREIKKDEKITVENGVGVFNGDIGYITHIDKGNMRMTVTFEDMREAEYSAENFDQLQLAYAISIHKSQGSEFNIVVIALMKGSYMILTRNLLYTAVTRAKNMVVIVGDKGVLQKMVENNYSKKRYTLLTDFLTRTIEN